MSVPSPGGSTTLSVTGISRERRGDKRQQICFPKVPVVEGQDVSCVASTNVRCCGKDRSRRSSASTNTSTASPANSGMGQLMVQRDFKPQFKVGLMAKDLRYAIETATARQIDLPVVRSARKVFEAARFFGRRRRQCDRRGKALRLNGSGARRSALPAPARRSSSKLEEQKLLLKDPNHVRTVQAHPMDPRWPRRRGDGFSWQDETPLEEPC